MVRRETLSVNSQRSIVKVCQAPVIYTRGYDDGTMLSLYYYIRTLYRTFHSLSPEVNLFTIGLDWNTHNYDPAGKIENVLNKVWTEIISEDDKAQKEGASVPFYEGPDMPVVVPINLRCNDYMDVRQLTDDVIIAVKGMVYNVPTENNAI